MQKNSFPCWFFFFRASLTLAKTWKMFHFLWLVNKSSTVQQNWTLQFMIRTFKFIFQHFFQFCGHFRFPSSNFTLPKLLQTSYFPKNVFTKGSNYLEYQTLENRCLTLIFRNCMFFQFSLVRFFSLPVSQCWKWLQTNHSIGKKSKELTVSSGRSDKKIMQLLFGVVWGIWGLIFPVWAENMFRILQINVVLRWWLESCLGSELPHF